MVRFTFGDGGYFEGDTADDVFDAWYHEGWLGIKSGLTPEEFVMIWAEKIPGITEDMPSIDFLRAIANAPGSPYKLEEQDAIARLADRAGTSAPRSLSSP